MFLFGYSYYSTLHFLSDCVHSSLHCPMRLADREERKGGVGNACQLQEVLALVNRPRSRILPNRLSAYAGAP
jgi:hypothetical protein